MKKSLVLLLTMFISMASVLSCLFLIAFVFQVFYWLGLSFSFYRPMKLIESEYIMYIIWSIGTIASTYFTFKYVIKENI